MLSESRLSFCILFLSFPGMVLRDPLICYHEPIATICLPLSVLMKLKAVKDDFQDVFDALPNGPIKTAVKEIIVILKQDNM